MSKIYTNTRVSLSLDTRTDISNATDIKIKYRKPSGIIGQWDAQLMNFSIATYTMSTSETLDEFGDWRLQVYVVIDNKPYLSSTVIMSVYDRFK